MADLHQDVPTREQIQIRAYELYVQRGGESGREIEDWLAAEQELRSQHSSATAKSGRQELSNTEKQQKPKAFGVVSGSKRL